MVVAVEPLGVPSLVGGWEGIVKIKFFPLFLELEAGTPNYLGFSPDELNSKVEEIFEKSKVGRDTKKGLTKVRKNTQVQD